MPQQIGEYRGCTLLLWPEYDPVHYTSSCTPWHRYTIDRVKEDINNYLGDPEPEDPTEDYWDYHSTYRGIEIMVWMPGSKAYGAWIGGNWTAAASVSTLKSKIDTFLGTTEPPADGNGAVSRTGALGLLVLFYLFFKAITHGEK